jgi:capsular exopolysaccharide synthesis family protein
MNNNSAIDKRNTSNIVSQTYDSLQEGLLNVLLRHRWTIFCVTVLSLLAAFIYILKATPIYTSSSRIFVEQSGPRIISEYEGLMTRSNNYLYTQGELIKSTPIVASVADEAKIQRMKTFEDIDNLTIYLKDKLNVNIGRKDDIITVSFDSPYPVEAAEIVNTVVQSYIDYHSTRRRSTVSEVLKILQKEKVKRDKELSDKFDELLKFTRENGVVSFDGQGGNVVLERLNKLSGALTEAQLNALNTKADYEATKSMKNEPAKIKQFASASSTSGVRVSINDRETQLQAELRNAEIELKNARYHCTEEHPSVKAIHAKIDRIQKELDEQAKEFADSYIEVMRLRWVASQQREDELQESFDLQLQQAKDLGIKATEYSVLQSELKRIERVCDIIDDRIKELNVTEDAGALNISILEVARPPDNPSKPEKSKYMAMALALGLILGGGLAVFRDMMDYRLRSADEISFILGIPVLGIIPTMPGGKSVGLPGNRTWFLFKLIGAGSYRKEIASESVGFTKSSASSSREDERSVNRHKHSDYSSVKWIQNISRKNNGSAHIRASRSKKKRDHRTSATESVNIRKRNVSSSDKPDVVIRGQRAHLEPKSIVAEAYRTVRTAIFFGVPKDQAKTILVTSPAPGDGKSTVASNLAVTMAQAGQKTVLLDADFRKPMQHKIFEIASRKNGLSDAVAGAISLDEAIQHGPVDGLDIIHCGTDIPNPSEVLNSDSFVNLLRELSGRYDRVVVDSPPVGPVADSQILSAICDVTILVLRAEVSTRKHSQQAYENLQSVGGHVLGAVVNDVRPRKGRYGYSGYGYYQNYGYYNKDMKEVS